MNINVVAVLTIFVLVACSSVRVSNIGHNYETGEGAIRVVMEGSPSEEDVKEKINAAIPCKDGYKLTSISEGKSSTMYIPLATGGFTTIVTPSNQVGYRCNQNQFINNESIEKERQPVSCTSIPLGASSQTTCR